MTIKWPDLKFPPVNLYSLPGQCFPHMYLELEREYCKAEAAALKDKRDEFNKLWNARYRN